MEQVDYLIQEDQEVLVEEDQEELDQEHQVMEHLPLQILVAVVAVKVEKDHQLVVVMAALVTLL